VDNGSKDDSVKQIQKAYPQHTLIEIGENLGFAEGNNVALRAALKNDHDLFLLLNNDTVVAPNFLSPLIETAEKHPDAGVFGPKIYFYDEPATIWYAGGSVDPKTGRCYHVGWGAPGGCDTLSQTDYVCGCALAVKREVLEKVGLLSPEYFLNWEEIDWCYRIRNAGYKCLYVPESKLWHKISASFVEGNRGPMWQYFYYRNRILFHKRHKVAKKAIPLSELSHLLKTSFKKRESRAALRGIIDAKIGRFGKGSLAKFL